jgi:hypothetical protein
MATTSAKLASPTRRPILRASFLVLGLKRRLIIRTIGTSAMRIEAGSRMLSFARHYLLTTPLPSFGGSGLGAIAGIPLSE